MTTLLTSAGSSDLGFVYTNVTPGGSSMAEKVRKSSCEGVIRGMKPGAELAVLRSGSSDEICGATIEDKECVHLMLAWTAV